MRSIEKAAAAFGIVVLVTLTIASGYGLFVVGDTAWQGGGLRSPRAWVTLSLVFGLCSLLNVILGIGAVGRLREKWRRP